MNFIAHEGLVVHRTHIVPMIFRECGASVGDFVRGRMGESTRQVDGLFESLLAESFGG